MQKKYYIMYHGNGFTSLNPRYKNGVTIVIASRKTKKEWWNVEEVITSPDKNCKELHTNFNTNTHGTVIFESDKHKIIDIMFTTWECY